MLGRRAQEQLHPFRQYLWRCLFCVRDYGNVTCASIPLTMATQDKEALSRRLNHCIACGFSVGLAWASMEFHLDRILSLSVVEYEK